jgi:hypothetical protein
MPRGFAMLTPQSVARKTKRAIRSTVVGKCEEVHILAWVVDLDS